AVSRIWKAIQSLDNAVRAEERPEPVPETSAAEVVPELADVPRVASETAQPEVVVPESGEPAIAVDVAPQTPDVALQAAPSNDKATRAKKAPKTDNGGAPREGSKTSQVIAMLKREGGVTLEEIMTAMGWQKHTTRAISFSGLRSLRSESREP